MLKKTWFATETGKCHLQTWCLWLPRHNFFGFITLPRSVKRAHTSGRNQFTLLVQSLKYEGPHSHTATTTQGYCNFNNRNTAGVRSCRNKNLTLNLTYTRARGKAVPHLSYHPCIKDVPFAWIHPTLCIWSLKNRVCLGDTPTVCDPHAREALALALHCWLHQDQWAPRFRLGDLIKVWNVGWMSVSSSFSS